MGLDLTALEPGSAVWVGAPEAPKPMKLAALFEVQERRGLFALLWAPDEAGRPGSQVFTREDCKDEIGILAKSTSVFGEKSAFSKLFHLLTFSDSAASELRSITALMAHSENMVRNAFLPSRMKARLPQIAPSGKRRSTNDFRLKPGRTGYVVGDITNATLKIKSDTTTIDYASLVSKGNRHLADSGDGGLPVLSSSNALVGFVVGSNSSHTLVVPAERMIDQYQIAFRTFPEGLMTGRTKFRTRPEVRKPRPPRRIADRTSGS